MVFPKHAYNRQKEAQANLDKLVELAGGYSTPKVAYLVHDIRTDLSHLTRQAQHWQNFCRLTGHDPFKPYIKEDDDG